MNKPIFAILAIMLTTSATAITAAEFDLSSQRKEIRTVNPVPGEKTDHHGFPINPTPQSMTIDNTKAYTLTNTPKQKSCDNTLMADAARAGVSSISYDISYGKRKLPKSVKPVSGAYTLTIDKNGAHINGYDRAGAFYGLQTLAQIEKNAQNGKIPFFTINDWPNIPRRGVIEGFYGAPWSHEVRLSLIDYYGRNKLNSYFYGPKDDPYHSVPNWRLPYPEKEAKDIRELVEASKRNHVDFIWAIHPGADIRWNEADYDSLLNKFNMMYDLGVRSFAIFMDDIDGDGRNPQKQVELFNRINREFVTEKGDVSNIVVCPTDYSRLWASTAEDGALKTYGRELDPKVEVFYTGDVVCSDLTHDTMDFFNSLIKRPGFYWWNYPVSDYCRNMILQGPVYGLETTMTEHDICGFGSNPMEHGEASKTALYSVADYCWNTAAYNPIDSWERALADLAPLCPEAYRTFAIHSADTETGYRRDESWETKTFFIDDYTPEDAEALRNEFSRIKAAPASMREKCGNQLLMRELNPWLTEFEKLGIRGLNTLDLLDIFKSGNDSLFWCKFVATQPSAEEMAAYEAHKMGTMKLQPFIDNARTDMVADFYNRLTGRVPMLYRGVGSYANSATTLANRMLDGDTTTYYTGAESQKKGDWIGVDLGTVRNVDAVKIRQGRNSVDDVDYFDHTVLQASADGNVWTDLTAPLRNTYDIVWTEIKPVEARYIRIYRLESERQNWSSVRTFEVNPPSVERLGIEIAADDINDALRAFDENPASAATISSPLTFQTKGTAITLLSSENSNADILFLDVNGNELGRTKLSGAFNRLNVLPDTEAITLVPADPLTLHEIIFE